MPCQPYAHNPTSGNRWTTEAALLGATVALVEAALANHQQDRPVPLALEVGVETGETYVVETLPGPACWWVAVDGRVVDATRWASLQAAALAVVATVLDMWDAE